MTNRTLLLTLRKIDSAVFLTWNYELEDVIAEVEDADVLAPELLRRGRLSSIGHRAIDEARDRLHLPRKPAVTGHPISRNYDLLFMACTLPSELLALEQSEGWRKRARVTACYIGEVWTRGMQLVEQVAPTLRKFDHIFLNIGASAGAVERVLGRPCHRVPIGIDAIRFCPYPASPARTVDCYSYGRRSAVTHRALLDLARRRDFFYLHDTASGAFAVSDGAEHRDMMANIAKRSRYFISYRHNDNLNARDKTGGEEGLGPRFFEGTAAGAVVLGSAPECPEFRECLGWEDSVIPIPVDAREIGRILAELDAQPERLARARRANVLGSLRQNDWVYRWQRMLGVMGLEPCAGVARRLEQLRALEALPSGERLPQPVAARL